MLSTREDREIRALRHRKGRESAGRFLAEGVRVVEDLLASDLTPRLLVFSSALEDTDRGRSLVHCAEEAGVPVRRVTPDALKRLAATETPQGVLAVADVPERTLGGIRGDGREVVLVLDAVQDPGNFGTLIRSAEALGAAGAIALPGTVDPWNPKAVRSAAGSVFRLPVVTESWDEARDWLQRERYRVLVAAAGGAPLSEPGGRVALVVGNEGAGVSPDVLEGADGTVGIHIRGRAESLNVAAAAAILMYELTR